MLTLRWHWSWCGLCSRTAQNLDPCWSSSMPAQWLQPNKSSHHSRKQSVEHLEVAFGVGLKHLGTIKNKKWTYRWLDRPHALFNLLLHTWPEIFWICTIQMNWVEFIAVVQIVLSYTDLGLTNLTLVWLIWPRSNNLTLLDCGNNFFTEKHNRALSDMKEVQSETDCRVYITTPTFFSLLSVPL